MNKDEKRKNLLRLLNQRIENNKPIKYSVFRKEDNALLSRIEKEFGSLSKACLELGISREDLVKKYGFQSQVFGKSLSEEEIIERLNYLKSINKISTSAMRTEFDDLRLESSIKSKYGSVSKGLELLGYKRTTKRYTKKSIQKQIDDMSDKGISLSYSSVNKIDPSLVGAVKRLFGVSWNIYLSQIGLHEHKIRKDYNKDEIQGRLQKILKEHGNLQQETVRKYDSGLCKYASTICGGYENMIKIFGLEKYWSPHSNINISKGKMLELLMKEYLDEMNIDYKYNKVIGNQRTKGCIRPDFNLGEKVIDCKLSAWTPSIEDTINKYSKHFSEITIVYLRGNQNTTKKFSDIATFINFKELIATLPQDRIKYFSEKADEILKLQIEP